MNDSPGVPGRSPMKTLCLAMALSATAGCASVDTSSHRDLLNEISTHNAVCGAAWQALVQEWLQNGGGVGPDLNEARQRIAADSTSRLSLLLQQAWAIQDPADVKIDKYFAFDDALYASDVVAQGCRSLAFFGRAMYAVPGAFKEGAIDALQRQWGSSDERPQLAGRAIGELLVSPSNALQPPGDVPHASASDRPPRRLYFVDGTNRNDGRSVLIDFDTRTLIPGCEPQYLRKCDGQAPSPSCLVSGYFAFYMPPDAGPRWQAMGASFERGPSCRVGTPSGTVSMTAILSKQRYGDVTFYVDEGGDVAGWAFTGTGSGQRYFLEGMRLRSCDEVPGMVQADR